MEKQYRAVIRQKIIDSIATSPPPLTHRDVWLPQVRGKATAVIGMRRAGKTSLLWQILRERLASGTPREGLLYFSFEDERLAGLQASDLDLLVETYYALYPDWRDQRRAVFFLDEIQLVAGWELFARRLLDSENIELFLSGSSARLLSREVATSMRGRAMEAVVLPFSFRESLRHQGVEPTGNVTQLPKAVRSMLAKHLLTYLHEGGFPEAQGLDVRNRVELLKGYVDLVLLRDVIERHAVAQPLALRWMVRQLLGNAGSLFSINKFHADMKSQGINVGKDTLYSYLDHLEDAFLVRAVNLASDSEARRRVHPRKIYPIDTGLIPIFDRSGKANLGHALETLVLHELDRRGAELGYVRTVDGFEVDFLARYPDGRSELIQVCTHLDAPETAHREIRALQHAASDYPDAQQLLLVLERPALLDLPHDISLITAQEWLLMA